MSDPRLSPAGRLWVLGTYRRTDQLDVPAFHRDVSDLRPLQATRSARLHLLPTALPREIAPLGAWLAGAPSEHVDRLTPVERLSLMLRYVASPLRYEPQNIYQIHRAVPSGRCLFPIDLLLLLPCADGTMAAFLYHPNFHAIEALDAPDLARLADPPQAVIAGVVRGWMIAEKYGDFTPFPILLEAGMLRSQLRLLRDALNWRGAQCDRDSARSYCTGDLEFPAFAETIADLSFDVAALPTRQAMLAVWNEVPHDPGDRPQLAEIIAAFDRPGDAEETPPPAPPRSAAEAAGRRGLLETMRLRHSANDGHGMYPALVETEPDLLDRFLRLAAAIRTRRAGTALEQRLEIKLVWLACSGAPTGTYGCDGRLLRAIDRSALIAATAQFLPVPLRYNFTAHRFMVLIAADPLDPLIAAAGGLREVHMAAGALAQDFTLAAAALGLFARPVRMLREAVLESMLPIDGQIVYTILCGAARSTNLTAELL